MRFQNCYFFCFLTHVPSALPDLNLLPLQLQAGEQICLVLLMRKPQLRSKAKGNRKFQIKPETTVEQESGVTLDLSPTPLQTLPSSKMSGVPETTGSKWGRRTSSEGRFIWHQGWNPGCLSLKSCVIWASGFSSMGLSFLICKMGLKRSISPKKYFWVWAWK